MNEYILMSMYEDGNRNILQKGEAVTEMEFLESVPDVLLKEEEWTVYEVMRSTDKSEYIHSGEIDELVEDS